MGARAGRGRGPEVGRGARGAGPVAGARPGPAAGLTRVATAAARGRGTGSSRDKPKMGNGEAWAAPGGVRSLCFGQTLLWLPEIRASGGFFPSFLSSLTRVCLGPEGRPLRGSQRPRTPAAPAAASPSLGPDSPPRGSRAWACCPRPAGCPGLLGLAVFNGGGGGGGGGLSTCGS